MGEDQSPHTPLRRFRLVFELLDDLHTGCGTGSARVDRALARDADNRPVIAKSHLQGVWRDNAERLVWLHEHGGPPLVTREQLHKLFGVEGGQRGCLITPELKPVTRHDGGELVEASPDSLDWAATARRAGDRVPDDHSLRATEYLASGQLLAGEGMLDTDEADLRAAFAHILRVTDHLGSERSRGSGLVRCLPLDWLPNRQVLAPHAPDADHTRLRLLLRATSPLCVPTTGAPGNIIQSETHIPGRMLFGALAGFVLKRQERPDLLFGRRIRIGPAYPLAPSIEPAGADDIAQIESIPIPLSLYSPKPGTDRATDESVPFSTWPHWAEQSQASTAPNIVERLVRKSEAKQNDKTRLKRPKPNAYLCTGPAAHQASAGWQLFYAPLGLRMRNARGSSFEHILETETALFSMEVIPAGTRFVADLHADDPADLRKLRELLADWLSGAAPLRVGRGGGALELDGWCAVETASASAEPDGASAPTSTSADDELRLTLTSDTIIRDPATLGFHDRLSVRALCDALGLDPTAMPAVHEERHFSDQQPYLGFNAVSGLPAAPKLAIRRGSCLLVVGPAAAKLREQLRTRPWLGERPWEGCGRFRLDFRPCGEGVRRARGSAVASVSRHVEQIEARERLMADAEQYADRLAAHLRKDDLTLTKSQIGNLRAVVAQAEGAGLEGIVSRLNGFAERVQSRRDAGLWKQVFAEGGLTDRLERACAHSAAPKDAADLFLRRLARVAEASGQPRAEDATQPEKEEAE